MGTTKGTEGAERSEDAESVLMQTREGAGRGDPRGRPVPWPQPAPQGGACPRPYRNDPGPTTSGRPVGATLGVDAVTFGHVGKRSPAHRLAWEVHRGTRSPDRVAELGDLPRYC